MINQQMQTETKTNQEQRMIYYDCPMISYDFLVGHAMMSQQLHGHPISWALQCFPHVERARGKYKPNRLRLG